MTRSPRCAADVTIQVTFTGAPPPRFCTARRPLWRSAWVCRRGC